jgi:hypothetical protein
LIAVLSPRLKDHDVAQAARSRGSSPRTLITTDCRQAFSRVAMVPAITPRPRLAALSTESTGQPRFRANSSGCAIELEGEKVFTIGSVDRSEEVDAPVELIA